MNDVDLMILQTRRLASIFFFALFKCGMFETGADHVLLNCFTNFHCAFWSLRLLWGVEKPSPVQVLERRQSLTDACIHDLKSVQCQPLLSRWCMLATAHSWYSMSLCSFLIITFHRSLVAQGLQASQPPHHLADHVPTSAQLFSIGLRPQCQSWAV